MPPADALFLPITFFVTICAADCWFQRGVVLPVLKQARNLFNAFIALPTALATLVAPPPNGMEDHRQRDKRGSAGLLADPPAGCVSDRIDPRRHPFHDDQWVVSGSRTILRSSALVLDGVATDHADAGRPS